MEGLFLKIELAAVGPHFSGAEIEFELTKADALKFTLTFHTSPQVADEDLSLGNPPQL
jgi:hypothetical protein